MSSFCAANHGSGGFLENEYVFDGVSAFNFKFDVCQFPKWVYQISADCSVRRREIVWLSPKACRKSVPAAQMSALESAMMFSHLMKTLLAEFWEQSLKPSSTSGYRDHWPVGWSYEAFVGKPCLNVPLCHTFGIPCLELGVHPCLVAGHIQRKQRFSMCPAPTLSQFRRCHVVTILTSSCDSVISIRDFLAASMVRQMEIMLSSDRF